MPKIEKMEKRIIRSNNYLLSPWKLKSPVNLIRVMKMGKILNRATAMTQEAHQTHRTPRAPTALTKATTLPRKKTRKKHRTLSRTMKRHLLKKVKKVLARPKTTQMNQGTIPTHLAPTLTPRVKA